MSYRKLLIFILILHFSNTNSVKIVCYYESWSSNRVTPENLNSTLCTHINYAFVGLNEYDGSLKITSKDKDLFKRFINLKDSNHDLKILLSVSDKSDIFSKIAENSTKRAAMVKSARTILLEFKLDGVDFDWETPQLKDQENFVHLLEDFRSDFDKNSWELSAAVVPIPTKGYNIPKLSKILDHINVMTYNMYGPSFSPYTGQNSPLFPSSIESNWERTHLNLKASVSLWIEGGADSGKMCPGIAFYGRSFTLSNLEETGLHANFSGPGKAGPVAKALGVFYNLEFCLTEDSWDFSWDSEQKMPIYINEDQWLGIDNQESITEKVLYMKRQNFAGTMIWAIDQEDVNGICESKNKQPLLKLINNLFLK